MKGIKKVSFIILLGISGAASVYADVAVIVHPDNHLQLNKEQLSNIFLDKVNVFDNGLPVSPVDIRRGDKAREVFIARVLEKTENSLSAYWSRMLFTSRGRQPRQVDNSAEVIKIVANNTSAIGYVDSKYVTDSVRVVFVIK